MRPLDVRAISAREKRTEHMSGCEPRPAANAFPCPCFLAYPRIHVARTRCSPTQADVSIHDCSLDHALWFHRPFLADDGCSIPDSPRARRPRFCAQCLARMASVASVAKRMCAIDLRCACMTSNSALPIVGTYGETHKQHLSILSSKSRLSTIRLACVLTLNLGAAAYERRGNCRVCSVCEQGGRATRGTT